MNMGWFLYAVLAMLFFSGMILLFKKLTLLNIRPVVLMLYVSLFLVLFYTLHISVSRSSIKVSSTAFIILLIAGFLSYLGNLFFTKSIALASNPGYAATIVGLQLAVITVASFFIFGSELTLMKGLGVLFAVIAGILLSL